MFENHQKDEIVKKAEQRKQVKFASLRLRKGLKGWKYQGSTQKVLEIDLKDTLAKFNGSVSHRVNVEKTVYISRR